MSILFRKLALGGGGVKGILHVGALLELQKRQPLLFPDGVYGCSIGSIFATCVAFKLPIEKLIPLVPKYLTFEKVMPELKFDNVVNSLSKKGVFEMDQFEKTISEFFRELDFDVDGKTLSDASMPLYIVGSNITKGCPTVFSGSVPLMKSILASCCLPGVFKPQEIYGQLYIDGDMFTPCISRVLDDKKDALILVLGKYPVAHITPKNVDTISPLIYSQTIFSMIMNEFSLVQKSPDILYLRYPKLRSTSDIKEFNIDDIVKSSAEQLSTFLTERGDQESSERSR